MTNEAESAIVGIEIPHFGGDLCLPPDGSRWDVTLTEVNATDARPGVCVLSAPSESAGIPPGARATFRLRVGPRGAPTGNGLISVTFADGTRASVDAVLPVAGSQLDRFAPLIGLSAMFGAFLLYRRLHAGRRDSSRVR